VVILDAAHALGAAVSGGPVNRYADMTVLSFHPAKHVATGEGGAILTDNKDYYDKLMLFRTHGILKQGDGSLDLKITMQEDRPPASEGAWYYEMRELGFNYRMTDIQCALGVSQLRKLGASLDRRQEIANRYKQGLDLDWLTLPPEPEDGRHAWHLYPVLVKKERRRFFDYLRSNMILAQVHYIPIHYFPYYIEKKWFTFGDFPNAEEFYAREVSLPMFPSLTDDEQQYVIDVVRRYG